jgi:hypothetical protein
MYADLLILFNRYNDFLKCTLPREVAREDLADEVRERISQLSFISAQLDEINAQFRIGVTGTRVNENGETEYYNAMFERDEHLRFVMRLLTESFYYFAFRVRQILRNDVHHFHGLRTFECAGVRNVRNHLIEHPEGSQSRVFNRTFTWTLEMGMQLKTGRHEWESSAFMDVGFKANASEFVEHLSRCLINATKELSSRTEVNFSPKSA